MKLGWRRIPWSVVLLVCVVALLSPESLVVTALWDEWDGNEGLSLEDWSRVVARWRPSSVEDAEHNHRATTRRLQQGLTSGEKWHFVVGFRNVRGYSAVRRLTRGARIHHLPIRNSSLHLLLTFITAAAAESIRHHRLFVEPLAPHLKIEDLTLGMCIRKDERHACALKAILAHDALSPREVASLAQRWEVALRGSYPDKVECTASAAAIVCSGVKPDAARFMASHAVVQLVELQPRYEVFNKWAKYVTQSVSGNQLPLFTKGLRGEGEVVACADTGVDMEHCFFRDRDRPVAFDAVDLQARKVVQYVVAWGDKTDFGGGHGTHVAGSIAGDTEAGSHAFAGMAPAAKLAFFDLGSNSSDLKAPFELGNGVFEYGYTAGARIFSNSWGVLRQGYGSSSHEVDSFSYL